MSIYGPIVTSPDVSDAVQSFLQLWMPAYLGEIGAQHKLPRSGDGSLPTIRQWAKSSSGLDELIESFQLPACAIVCPGITGGIEERGDGSISAEFAVGLAFVVSARTQDETNTLLGYYVAAARSAVLQHKSLGGFATGVRWVDERLDQLNPIESRTLAGGEVNLGVRVNAVLNSHAGPPTPPDDPYADPGEAATVETAEVVTERLA